MKLKLLALTTGFLLLGCFVLGMSEDSSLSYDVEKAEDYVEESLSRYFVNNQLTRDEIHALDALGSYDSSAMYCSYLIHGLLPEEEQFSIEELYFNEYRDKWDNWDIYGEIQYPWEFVETDDGEFEVVPTYDTPLYTSESIVGLAETLMLCYGNQIKYLIVDGGIIGEETEYYTNNSTQKEEEYSYIKGYITLEIQPLDVFQGMTRENLDEIYYNMEASGQFQTKDELIHGYLHTTLRLLIAEFEGGKEPIYKEVVTDDFELFTSKELSLSSREIKSDYMFFRNYDKPDYGSDESLRLLSTLMDFYPSEE